MSRVPIKYFCILTIFITISCSRVVERDVIKKEEMVNILIDMHLMEESIDLLRLESDTAKALFNTKEKEILKQWIRLTILP